MKRAMVLLLALTALLASAACQSDNKVGNKALLDFKEQANNRLGETTTTTAAPTTTTVRGAVTTTTKATVKPGAVAPTTTTARSASAPAATTPTTAAARAAQTIREIDIYDDDAAQPLDPQIQTAYLGSIIRWVNKGKADRVVKADSGQFASPTIHPGASWDYTANTAGVFAYSDDTRPYVHGELRVSKP
jgi:plastocyanin